MSPDWPPPVRRPTSRGCGWPENLSLQLIGCLPVQKNSSCGLPEGALLGPGTAEMKHAVDSAPCPHRPVELYLRKPSQAPDSAAAIPESTDPLQPDDLRVQSHRTSLLSSTAPILQTSFRVRSEVPQSLIPIPWYLKALAADLPAPTLSSYKIHF